MGEEMNDLIIENFNKLCQKFRSVNYAETGEDEMESLYEELLGFCSATLSTASSWRSSSWTTSVGSGMADGRVRYAFRIPP